MSATHQFRLVLVLVALAGLGVAAIKYFDHLDQDPAQDPAQEPVPPDYRLPVANPPVEPDRPDLLEEPRIDE